jgi:hypothetical protein
MSLSTTKLSNYHENLQGISQEIHPFSLTDNAINDAKNVG